MFKCIANKENLFLVLDTNDGVSEWVSLRECRKYLKGGINIEGLKIVSLDAVNSFIDFTPVLDFVPSNIIKELSHYCIGYSYSILLYIIKTFILMGNNIIELRNKSNSFNIFRQALERWYNNGQYVSATNAKV